MNTTHTENLLRAILIDDEVNCLKILEWELNENCPEVQVEAACSSGKAGLKAIKEYKPDVVFLDIEMPYLNGFEVLELVGEPDFEVIFTTAYDKFAVRAFKSSAIDYLLKPIDGEDLRAAVDKLHQKRKVTAPKLDINFLLQQLEDAKKNRIKRIALATFEGLTLTDAANVLYCQSDNNYCYVVLKDKRKVLISKTLKEMEEVLSADNFYRVHNSYLVNLDEVTNYLRADGGLLRMSNGDEVKISRSRKEQLLELLS